MGVLAEPKVSPLRVSARLAGRPTKAALEERVAELEAELGGLRSARDP